MEDDKPNLATVEASQAETPAEITLAQPELEPPRKVAKLDLQYCSHYRHAIELIGKRWTGAIVRVLIQGPHRFHEILTAIPDLSDRLLSERLRQLESEALVVRHVVAGPPIKVEYALTAAGKDLEKVVDAISLWARKWVKINPADGKAHCGGEQ